MKYVSPDWLLLYQSPDARCQSLKMADPCDAHKRTLEKDAEYIHHNNTFVDFHELLYEILSTTILNNILYITVLTEQCIYE